MLNKLLSTKLNKPERQALGEFKKILKQQLTGQIMEIKLFGSKTRSDSHQNSDTDVLVVLKNDTEKNKDKVFDVVQQILFKHEILLSPVIFNQQEYKHLNNIPTIFMQNLRFEGIPL